MKLAMPSEQRAGCSSITARDEARDSNILSTAQLSTTSQICILQIDLFRCIIVKVMGQAQEQNQSTGPPQPKAKGSSNIELK